MSNMVLPERWEGRVDRGQRGKKLAVLARGCSGVAVEQWVTGASRWMSRLVTAPRRLRRRGWR